MKTYKENNKISTTAMKKLLTGHTQKKWVKSKEKGVPSSFQEIALTTLYAGGEVEVKSVIEHPNISYLMAESKTQRFRWVFWKKEKKVSRFSCVDLEALERHAKSEKAEGDAE